MGCRQSAWRARVTHPTKPLNDEVRAPDVAPKTCLLESEFDCCEGETRVLLQEITETCQTLHEVAMPLLSQRRAIRVQVCGTW